MTKGDMFFWLCTVAVIIGLFFFGIQLGVTSLEEILKFVFYGSLVCGLVFGAIHWIWQEIDFWRKL